MWTKAMRELMLPDQRSGQRTPLNQIWASWSITEQDKKSVLVSRRVLIKAHGCLGGTAVLRVQGWWWQRRGQSTALASFLGMETSDRLKSRGTRNKTSLFRS